MNLIGGQSDNECAPINAILVREVSLCQRSLRQRSAAPAKDRGAQVEIALPKLRVAQACINDLPLQIAPVKKEKDANMIRSPTGSGICKCNYCSTRSSELASVLPVFASASTFRVSSALSDKSFLGSSG